MNPITFAGPCFTVVCLQHYDIRHINSRSHLQEVSLIAKDNRYTTAGIIAPDTLELT